MNNFLAPIGVSHNGAPGLRFLERSILKNAQGLSPCSSASDSYGCGMNNLLAPFEVYHNERFFFKVLELVLQNNQSRSPLSSASLYFVTHSSTPCAKLANSLEATFLSRYSIVSGVKVTVREIFFTLFIQGRFLWKLINNHKYHSFLTRTIRVGGPKMKTSTLSADAPSAPKKEYYGRAWSLDLSSSTGKQTTLVRTILEVGDIDIPERTWLQVLDAWKDMTEQLREIMEPAPR